MPVKPEKSTASSTPSRGGTFLMTPAQHRMQAELMRQSEDPEVVRRAVLHDQLAAAIEKRSADAVQASQ